MPTLYTDPYYARRCRLNGKKAAKDAQRYNDALELALRVTETLEARAELVASLVVTSEEREE